jgi:hypothetical protein
MNTGPRSILMSLKNICRFCDRAVINNFMSHYNFCLPCNKCCTPVTSYILIALVVIIIFIKKVQLICY